MRTVTHREMRNQSGEILREVAAGGTIQVTSRGKVVAEIIPPRAHQGRLEELIAQGRARPASRPLSGLEEIQPKPSRMTTEEIVADLHGRW